MCTICKHPIPLFLLLFLPILGLAQTPAPQAFLGVEFEGLKKTDASYLNQVLRIQSINEWQPEDLDSYTQKLANLTNIASASHRVDTLEEGLLVVFEIEEARTLFPILNFGGIKNNFWYQLGFTDINWLGQGMQLTAFYQNNDRRSNYNLFYKVPYIKGSKWGGSVSILRFASIEPLFFDEGVVRYNYDNLNFGLSAFYEFKIGHTLELGGSYFIESYEKNENQPLSDPPGPDNLRQPKWLGKLVHRYDKINYHYYKLNGFAVTTIFETVYNTLDQDWFGIVLNDVRYYKTFGRRTNLAMRIRLGISSNRDTPFAPFVLDSNVNIRGSGNRIDRGTAQAIWNLEYRYSIWDPKGRNFAAQLVAFSDLGTWRNPGGDFSDLWESSNFRHFIGGGFRLIYKKAFNAILRVDYGIDIYDVNQRGFVIGIGQYI